MNITAEKTGELTQQITINVSKSDFMPEVDKQLKKYHREARIPGFRPGKVPMGMIKRMYEKPVMVDELNSFVSKSLQNYVDENSLKLLGDPLPSADQEQVNLDEGESFDFKFDIATQPVLDFQLTDKITSELFVVNISDKEIDAYLVDLRKRNGKVVEAEVSEDGDFLRGDLAELDSDGQAKPDGITKSATLIAINRMPEGDIRSRFIGAKVGDKVVFNPLNDVKNETEISSMLGIEKSTVPSVASDFEFVVGTVNRIEPADMNEEFYSQVFSSDNITTEEGLRERISRDLSESYERESRKMFYYETLDMLVDKANISLPDDFMKRWLEYQSEEEISSEDAEMRWSIYAPMLRRQLLEGHLLNAHDVKITMEDMEKLVLQMMGMNMDLDDEQNRDSAKRLASSVLQDEKQFERIRDEAIREKFTDLLIDNIKVKQRKVEVDEFINFVNEKNK